MQHAHESRVLSAHAHTHTHRDDTFIIGDKETVIDNVASNDAVALGITPPGCTCTKSDRDCMIDLLTTVRFGFRSWVLCDSVRLLLQVLGPPGNPKKPVSQIGLPDSYTKGTSCGDVVGTLVHRWGSSTNCYFMVSETVKYTAGGAQPQPGDIFVLIDRSNPPQRKHVGFVYSVQPSADGTSFQWISAEGGQGPQSAQTMWISDTPRGPGQRVFICRVPLRLVSFSFVGLPLQMTAER